MNIRNFVEKNIKSIQTILIVLLLLTAMIVLSMISHARFASSEKTPDNISLKVDSSITPPPPAKHSLTFNYEGSATMYASTDSGETWNIIENGTKVEFEDPSSYFNNFIPDNDPSTAYLDVHDSKGADVYSVKVVAQESFKADRWEPATEGPGIYIDKDMSVMAHFVKVVPETVTLSGTVEAPDINGPVADASVYWTSAKGVHKETTTNAEGKFSFVLAKGDGGTLDIYADHFVPNPFTKVYTDEEMASDPEPITPQLKSASLIKGDVADVDSSASIAYKSTIKFVTDEDTYVMHSQTGSFSGLVPKDVVGKWQVTAQGYEDYESDEVSYSQDSLVNFTLKKIAVPEVKAVFAPSELYDGSYDLTWYYDTESHTDDDVIVIYQKDLPQSASEETDWPVVYNSLRTKVSTIAIDETMKDCTYFKSGANMFYNMVNVEEIIENETKSLSYINTSTDASGIMSFGNMSYMFQGLGSTAKNPLTINMQGWNSGPQSEVAKYTWMFKDCNVGRLITGGGNWNIYYDSCELMETTWYDELTAEQFTRVTIPVGQGLAVRTFTRKAPTPKTVYRENVPVEDSDETQNTLTFYYNSLDYSAEESSNAEYIANVYNKDQMTSDINMDSSTITTWKTPDWIEIQYGDYKNPIAKITPNTVIVDKSFKQCKQFSSISYWFSDFKEVTKYSGLENLKFADNKVSQANFAFCKNEKLESITLPDSCVYTGSDANQQYNFVFYDCSNLKTISLPNNFANKAKYIDSIFANTQIKNLSLPNGFGANVVSLNKEFENCKDLETISLPSNFGQSATTIIDSFNGCNKLVKLSLPTNFGKSATYLSGVFANCQSLESLSLNGVFGANLENLGDPIFENAGSTKVNFVLKLPNNFGNKAPNLSCLFKGCNAREIVLPQNFGAEDCDYKSLTEGCNLLVNLDASYVKITNEDQIDNKFIDSSSLQKFTIGEDWSTDVSFDKAVHPLLSSSKWLKYDSAESVVITDIPAVSGPGTFVLESSSIFSYPLKINIEKALIKDNIPIGWSPVGGKDNEYVKNSSKYLEGSNVEKIKNEVITDWDNHVIKEGDKSVVGWEVLSGGKQTEIWTSQAYVSPIFVNNIAFIDAAKWRNLVLSKDLKNVVKSIEFVDDQPGEGTLIGEIHDSNRSEFTLEVWLNNGSLSFYSSKSIYAQSVSCQSMFEGFAMLEKFNGGSQGVFRTFECNNFTRMFADCIRLNDLDIQNFEVMSSANTTNMVAGCISLEKINIPPDDKLQKKIDQLGFDKNEEFYQSNNKYTAEQIPSAEVFGEFVKNTAKAVYKQNDDASTYTFTFYYDNEEHPIDTEKDEMKFDAVDMISTNSDTRVYPKWLINDGGYCVPVFKVIPNTVCFDESFKKYRGLKSLSFWFNHFTSDLVSTNLADGKETSLTKVEGLESIDYTNIVETTQMFYECTYIEEIVIPGELFNHSKDCYRMFNDCINLQKFVIDNSSETCGENISDLSSIFGNCENLEWLDLPNGFGKNTSDIGGAFSGCKKLAYKDEAKTQLFKLPDDFGSKAVDWGYTFDGCSSLKNDKNDPLCIKANNVTFGACMFQDCFNLKAIDLSNCSLASKAPEDIGDFNRVFLNANNLNYLKLHNTWFTSRDVFGMQLINSCDLVGDQNWPWVKTVNGKHEGPYVPGEWEGSGGLFERISARPHLHIDEGITVEDAPSNWKWDDASRDYVRDQEFGIGISKDRLLYYLDNEWQDAVFKDTSEQERIGWDVNSEIFDDITSIKPKMGELASCYLNDEVHEILIYEDYELLWRIHHVKFGRGSSRGPEYDQEIDISAEQDRSVMAYYNRETGNMLIQSEGITKSKGLSMADIFRDFVSLDTIEIKNLDTSEAAKFNNAFDGCISLTNLNLSGLNLDNVDDFSHMCNGCEKLESIRFGSHSQEVHTRFTSAFAGCSVLQKVDFGNCLFAPIDASSYNNMLNTNVTEISINHTWNKEIVTKLGLADQLWFYEGGPDSGQTIADLDIPTEAEGVRTFIKDHHNATATVNLNGGKAINPGWWNNLGFGLYSKKFFTDTDLKYNDILYEWVNNITPPKDMVFDHWEVDGQPIDDQEPFVQAKTFTAVWANQQSHNNDSFSSFIPPFFLSQLLFIFK